MEIDELQGGDITAADMIEPQMEPSEIQEFYANKTVFLTGASGFCGMVILEKILRACPDVRTVYLLLRQKKGITVEERLENILKSPLYDKLKLKHPSALRKIQIISGDIGEENLGLLQEDRRKITEEVDIVIHVAATIKFIEHIRTSTHINVRGTRDLLLLARKMKQLKAFVHVSTAFCQLESQDLSEKFGEAPYDYEKLITLVASASDEVLTQMTPLLLGKFPFTYVFTKAIAEDVVKRCGEGLPVVVVRPSQVVSTSDEPIIGWTKNFNGPMGFVSGIYVGLIRVLHLNSDCLADLIPVDFFANCVIAATWDIGRFKLNNQEFANNSEIKVFHCVGSRKAITWGKIMLILKKAMQTIGTNRATWRPFILLIKNKHVHFVSTILLHFLPAILGDFCLRVVGKKPYMFKLCQKIFTFLALINFCVSRDWNFQDTNTQQLFANMSRVDQRMFNFSLNNFSWDEYILKLVRGVRIYLLEDPMDTVPQAQRRAKLLDILHYSVCAVLTYLLLTFCLFLFRML